MRCIQTLTSSILITLLFLSSCPQNADAELIDRTVAQVGDKVITLGDIEAYAPWRVKQINALPLHERDEAWKAYIDEVLKIMIESVTLQVAAARMGAVVSAAEIDEGILIARNENTQFRALVGDILAREGTTTPEVRLIVQNYLLETKVTPSLSHRVVVTDEDIYHFLENNPDADLGQTEYDVWLLFLPDEAQYRLFTEALARSDFEEAARKMSQDPTHLEWITKTHLVPEMARVMAAMNVGDVSAPIVDEDGRYMVLYLADMRLRSGVTDAMKEYALKQIKQERTGEVYQKWLEKSKKSILVNIYEI